MLRRAERELVLTVILILICVTALVGIIQFSGSSFNSPFVNDSTGEVSSFFANRNHFALFLALGCVLAPVWGTRNSAAPTWRVPLAIGLVILFLLLILASGSRAGVAVGLLGATLGFWMARDALHQQKWRLPRWAEPVAAATIIAVIAGFVVASSMSGRTQSIDRLVAIHNVEDMRSRGLPTVLGAIQAYFPVGSGFGSFDTVFRMREPFELLKPTYFNHAHNDFLEVAIGGGLPAVILLVVALCWWVSASVRVWRMPPVGEVMQGRVGSAMLLLVFVASAFDYPARTPIVMAVTALAAVWLEWGATPQTALRSSRVNL
ncbi:O-antigen ligase family protein [Sphingomonas faeni]|uniref:O-antigen ligase family protein n=1 Tax=Sphingomonas faeni TaxID=185950 RepID=UPI0027D92A28|nr:O-antigen ligase family protein [Sphingomonas faeni]